MGRRRGNSGTWAKIGKQMRGAPGEGLAAILSAISAAARDRN
jgi:hypothetical protein